MPVRRHPIMDPRTPGPAADIPADEALIARLRASIVPIRAEGLAIAARFYEALFAAAPAVRPLFRGDLDAQAAKLIAALDAVVANLERPAANAALIRELGKRHATYGARPEHYALVTDLLVRAIGEHLGDRIDGRTLEDWRLVLTLVSRQMIAASADPNDSTVADHRPGEARSRPGGPSRSA